MTNPKSEAPSGWVPTVGDIVSGKGDRFSEDRVFGKVVSPADVYGVIKLACASGTRLVWADTLVPAPPADAQAEMYGTMPPVGELPETLPAGATSVLSSNPLTGWELDRRHQCGHPAYVPPGRVGTSCYQHADPRNNVKWSTVPRPPNPAPVEEWQPSVGEMCAGNWDGERRTGEFIEFYKSGERPSVPMAKLNNPHRSGWHLVTRASLTRVSEPAKNASVDRGQGQSLDPHRATTLDDIDILKRAAWYLEQDAIHAAKLAAHERKKRQATAQLDAKLPAHPKTWPSAWSSAGWESDP